MEVYERINLLIQEKSITKRDFARLLISLEPKSKRTGEIMSEKAVYAYLSGASVINSDLIPYIAEALDVSEQSLFSDDAKTRKRLLKYLLESLSKEEKKTIEKFYIDNLIPAPYREIIELLPHASESLLTRVRHSLLEMKKISEKT